MRESQIRATTKYNRENYDVIQLRLPKGERQVIKEFAEKQGESLNAFFLRLAHTEIEKNTASGD